MRCGYCRNEGHRRSNCKRIQDPTERMPMGLVASITGLALSTVRDKVYRDGYTIRQLLGDPRYKNRRGGAVQRGPRPGTSMRCSKCKRFGHNVRTCGKPSTYRKPTRTVRCSACGKTGHIRTRCPRAGHLTPKQVATETGLSLSTVYRRIRNGETLDQIQPKRYKEPVIYRSGTRQEPELDLPMAVSVGGALISATDD